MVLTFPVVTAVPSARESTVRPRLDHPGHQNPHHTGRLPNRRIHRRYLLRHRYTPPS